MFQLGIWPYSIRSLSAPPSGVIYNCCVHICFTKKFRGRNLISSNYFSKYPSIGYGYSTPTGYLVVWVLYGQSRHRGQYIDTTLCLSKILTLPNSCIPVISFISSSSLLASSENQHSLLQYVVTISHWLMRVCLELYPYSEVQLNCVVDPSDFLKFFTNKKSLVHWK